MNTSPRFSKIVGRVTGLFRRPWAWPLAALVVVLAVALVYGLWSSAGRASAAMTAPVKRGPLTISVNEAGTIQNRERVVIKCEVEGGTSIIYLIPEGTRVQEGDLLVELDSSKLIDQRDQQQITVGSAEAAFIRARENLAVVKSQADSDIAKAKLVYQFAQQDLDKYLKGDYPRQLQKAQSDIQIAEEEYQRAKDTLEWSTRLAKDGYITKTELQADQLAANRTAINVNLAKTDLKLLQEYTNQRSLDQLTSDAEQAKEALDRTTRKASADVVQAEADLKAKQSEFQQQQDRLKKTEEQIAKCHLVAPREGMVVYATTGQPPRGRMNDPLAEGQSVRERQDLIYLPSSTAMKVDIKVREANLLKIHKGMPARVTVEAFSGEQFWGEVGKIGVLPDSQFFNPDLKVYSTEIHLEDTRAILRAGMSCQAEIIVDQYADALYVPVQSIVRENGKTMAYVKTSRGVVPREVSVGLDNNQMIRVLNGLAEGELVLLSPPLSASEGKSESASPAAVSTERLTASRPATDAASAQAPATSPASRSAEGRQAADQREEGRRRFENMTPEQREEMRKRFESMTPEQREEIRKRMTERRGDGKSGGRRSSGEEGG